MRDQRTVATANVSSWGTGRLLLEAMNDHRPDVNIVALQEHRIKSKSDWIEAREWATKAGWQLLGELAFSTGPSAKASSSGVALAIKKHVGHSKWEPLDQILAEVCNEHKVEREQLAKSALTQ